MKPIATARMAFLKHVPADAPTRPSRQRDRGLSPRQMAFFVNLAEVCDTITPTELDAGRRWYPEETERATLLARDYHVSPIRLIQAIAAMSPGIRFEAAIQNARIVLDAVARGDHQYPMGAGLGYEVPFGYRGVERAWALLTTDRHAGELLRGTKVEAFAANLLGDLTRVTIDRHVTRAATRNALDQASPQMRQRIVEAFTAVADLHHVAPAELQAALYLHNLQPRGSAKVRKPLDKVAREA